MATSTATTERTSAEAPPPPGATPTQAEADAQAGGPPEVTLAWVDPQPPWPGQAHADALVMQSSGILVPVCTSIPDINGNGGVGDTLSSTMGNWYNDPTGYAYQWLSDGDPVGTDSADYVVKPTDAGKSITCRVTASNAAGSTTAPPGDPIVIAAAAAADEARTTTTRRTSA